MSEMEIKSQIVIRPKDNDYTFEVSGVEIVVPFECEIFFDDVKGTFTNNTIRTEEHHEQTRT